MDCEVKIKTKTLSDMHPWHGNSSLFFNRMNAFFADTSYAKHDKLKQIKEKTLNSLNDKYLELEQQEKVKMLASIARKTTEKWNEIKKTLVNQHFIQQKTLETAAISIQRHVRGYLTRIKVEFHILQLREIRTDYLINETEQISKVCLFYLGDCATAAAILIQKSLKRYIFRLKLYRLIRIYYSFMEAKSKIASDTVRKFLLKFACREKIESILFEKHKERRLKVIIENLAILKIKKFWKGRKMNFRILRDKILRLKRRKTALANKEKFSKMLTNSSKTDKSPIKRSLTKSLTFEYSEDEEVELPENAEARQKAIEEMERVEKEKEKTKKIFQEKVSISKIAHGVKENKKAVVIPFLQERELAEIVTSSLEVRLYETTFSSAQKMRKFDRTVLPQIRNTQISSPNKVWQKRLSVQCDILPPLLLADKQCAQKVEKNDENLLEIKEFNVNSHKSKCKRHFESQSPSYQPNPHHRHFILRKQFLSKDTVANMMKKEVKKEKKSIVKIWKTGNKFSDYVSGIDNSSFEKKPWKPLRLDRSILETNASTQFASGNIKMHMRNNSDPTSNFSLLSN